MYHNIRKTISIAEKGIQFNGQRVIRAYEHNCGDYVKNAFGHIRNDFAVLQDSNNAIDMARVLARMQELDMQNVNQGKTFEQIVAEIRPRWCQSPAELDRFEQYCIDNALAFYKKLKENTDKETAEAVGAAVAANEPAPKSE